MLTGMDFKRATDLPWARQVARVDGDTPTDIAGALDSVVYLIRVELPTLQYRGKSIFEAARSRCVGTPRHTFAESQVPTSHLLAGLRCSRWRGEHDRLPNPNRWP